MILEEGEVQRESDQPLLGSVVQVALKALTFSLGGLDDSRARPAQLFESGSKLDVQLGILQRDAEGRRDRLEKLTLFFERWVVKKGGNTVAVPLDERHRPRGARVRQRDRPALGVGVRPELREPVGQCERGVTQGAGNSLLQLGRLGFTAKLDEEVAHRRPGEPSSQMADQEQEGRNPDQPERDPTDRECPGSSDGQHERAGHQPDQRKRKADDEQFERESKRTPRGPTARDEGANGRKPDDGHGSPLDLHDGSSIGAGQVEHDAQQIEAEDDRVAAHDDEAIEPAREPTTRIGEKNVEEDHCREQPQALADHTSRLDIRIAQPREGRRKARGNHQGTEAALGPFRPRDQPAAEVRDDDPSDEPRVNVRKRTVLAGQAQLVRANGCDDSG